MLIRVRSSMGTWKIPLNNPPDTATLFDVKQLIYNQHDIPIESQLLSRDLKSEHRLEPDSASLKSLSISHGDMIFLSGRLEKQVIEKSYIGENGELVKAGIKLNLQNTNSVEDGNIQANALPPETKPLNTNQPILPSFKEIKPENKQENISAQSVNKYHETGREREREKEKEEKGSEMKDMTSDHLKREQGVVTEDDYETGPISPDVRQPDPVKRSNLLFDESYEEEREREERVEAIGNELLDNLDMDAVVAAMAAGVSQRDLLSGVQSSYTRRGEREREVSDQIRQQTEALTRMHVIPKRERERERRRGSDRSVGRRETEREREMRMTQGTHTDDHNLEGEEVDPDLQWALQESVTGSAIATASVLPAASIEADHLTHSVDAEEFPSELLALGLTPEEMREQMIAMKQLEHRTVTGRNSQDREAEREKAEGNDREGGSHKVVELVSDKGSEYMRRHTRPAESKTSVPSTQAVGKNITRSSGSGSRSNSTNRKRESGGIAANTSSTSATASSSSSAHLSLGVRGSSMTVSNHKNKTNINTGIKKASDSASAGSYGAYISATEEHHGGGEGGSRVRESARKYGSSAPGSKEVSTDHVKPSQSETQTETADAPTDLMLMEEELMRRYGDEVTGYAENSPTKQTTGNAYSNVFYGSNNDAYYPEHIHSSSNSNTPSRSPARSPVSFEAVQHHLNEAVPDDLDHIYYPGDFFTGSDEDKEYGSKSSDKGRNQNRGLNRSNSPLAKDTSMRHANWRNAGTSQTASRPPPNDGLGVGARVASMRGNAMFQRSTSAVSESDEAEDKPGPFLSSVSRSNVTSTVREREIGERGRSSFTNTNNTPHSPRNADQSAKSSISNTSATQSSSSTRKTSRASAPPVAPCSSTSTYNPIQSERSNSSYVPIDQWGGGGNNSSGYQVEGYNRYNQNYEKGNKAYESDGLRGGYSSSSSPWSSVKVPVDPGDEDDMMHREIQEALRLSLEEDQKKKKREESGTRSTLERYGGGSGRRGVYPTVGSSNFGMGDSTEGGGDFEDLELKQAIEESLKMSQQSTAPTESSSISKSQAAPVGTTRLSRQSEMGLLSLNHGQRETNKPISDGVGSSSIDRRNDNDSKPVSRVWKVEKSAGFEIDRRGGNKRAQTESNLSTERENKSEQKQKIDRRDDLVRNKSHITQDRAQDMLSMGGGYVLNGRYISRPNYEREIVAPHAQRSHRNLSTNTGNNRHDGDGNIVSSGGRHHTSTSSSGERTNRPDTADLEEEELQRAIQASLQNL